MEKGEEKGAGDKGSTCFEYRWFCVNKTGFRMLDDEAIEMK